MLNTPRGPYVTELKLQFAYQMQFLPDDLVLLTIIKFPFNLQILTILLLILNLVMILAFFITITFYFIQNLSLGIIHHFMDLLTSSIGEFCFHAYLVTCINKYSQAFI